MANSKSAINLLQEMTVTKGYIPVYNFMEKRIDSVSIQFTCSVSCQQMNACGVGNSKKEAKHNAASNMLLLLENNNKIPLPVDTLSSASVANIIQGPAKVSETSPSCKQLAVDRNYVGLLQEFCQQKKISARDILYELVYDEGLSHQKIFTIEVSVGSQRERGTASTKKTAKQEAARKLLLHLNPNATDLYTVNLNGAQNTVNSNDINIPLNLETLGKEMLESSIQKLGIKISNSATDKETEELSEKAKLLYLERTNKTYQKINQKSFGITELHNLFEKNYSNKIQNSMREKMRIILREKYFDRADLMQTIRDIESSLKVKTQQTTVRNKEQNHIICLRLLSTPCITQFGMGETKFIAESRAMFNLIKAILIFLND